MACNIPSFNFDFKAIYDLSVSAPSVQIIQNSTGANLNNISYIFILYDPNGNVYHQGSWLTPDAVGVWASIDIAEQIPQAGLHVQFSNLPYRIMGYAKDNSGNICELEKLDAIVAPPGNDGKNNFGKISIDTRQKCDKAKLEVRDITQYTYSGGLGVSEDSVFTFVYPTNEGTPLPNVMIHNKSSFSIPIPVNSEGHEMYGVSTVIYTLPSGNKIRLKFKYSNKNIIINCGISKCSIMCGLTKYREKLEGKSGTCSELDSKKVNSLVLKIAQLLFGMDSPDCGIDINALFKEIKDELLENDCYCDCNDSEFNNGSTSLRCSDIDIECVYGEIISLINSSTEAKTQICAVVQDCITQANSSACGQPFISTVLFTETSISINFMLSNATNSTSLKVYYKLHSDSSWTEAQTLPSNATNFDITGTFTAGDAYDVKVSNVCASSEVDSLVITGVIVQPMSSCSLLQQIYTGLTDGLYLTEVDTTQSILCNKIKPKKITSATFLPFLPCSAPASFRINSSALLEWSGEPGDYQIFYKKKTDLTWTNFGINTYMGIENSEDLSPLALTPLSDYEFRLRHSCNSGANLSIPLRTWYQDPANRCESAGDFIGFDQTTGALTWAGGSNGSATYVVEAEASGTSLGNPTSIIITPSVFGTLITCDYSSIASLISATTLNPGDTILFSIKQNCGGGVFSDVATKYYTIEGIASDCNNVTMTVTSGNGGLVSMTASTFPSNVSQLQYEVGIVIATIFYPILTGITSLTTTSVYFPIPIENGMTIRTRWRSICGCCGNASTYSNWDLQDIVSANQNWDDKWKDIPSGWMLNGVQAKMGASTGKYKIDKNGCLHFRGMVDLVAATPTPYQYPNGTTNVDLEFMDFSALSTILNSSTDLATSADYYPATERVPLPTAGVSVTSGAIQRNGYKLKLTAKIVNTTGSGVSNGIQINISHVSIK